MQSLLLDIDHRYVRRDDTCTAIEDHCLLSFSLIYSCACIQAQFYPPDSFQRYNMFNSFFYSTSGETVCREFLSCAADSNTALVVDPPFGGLAEILAKGIKQLWDMAKQGQRNYIVSNPNLSYFCSSGCIASPAL